MAKWQIPTLAITLAGGVSGIGSWLVLAGTNFPEAPTQWADDIVTHTTISDLMSLSLTAGALVLAVWGILITLADTLVAKIPYTTPAKVKEVKNSIDAMLASSIVWFISFCCFLVAYVFSVGFDDLLDMANNPDNGFAHAGLLQFIVAVGNEAASAALFAAGFLLLVFGSMQVVLSLHRLAPLLAIST